MFCGWGLSYSPHHRVEIPHTTISADQTGSKITETLIVTDVESTIARKPMGSAEVHPTMVTVLTLCYYVTRTKTT